MSIAILRGDARSLPLADESVDLIVTSPPYFALRDYRDRGESLPGQLGAEATPAEYVAALVDCTREWVRVLKPSGSVFVNLGDKYSSGEPFDNELTVGDAGWLAGLIDADGTITVRRAQQPKMRAPTFEGIIAVEQEDREAVERALAITGRGAICTVTGSRGKPMYRWTVSTQQARWVAERIWPWLRIKQRQALAVVELGRHRAEHSARGRWNPIKPEWIEYREAICSAVRAWNRRERHDWQPPVLPVIELPLRPRRVQPKSLLGLPWRYAIACADDLGLIIRRDIIWDKANCLPESVTDRAATRHEYVFHLVKQPRYFAAIDEIREPHAEVSLKRAAPHRSQAGRRPAEIYPTAPEQTLRLDQANHALGKLPGSVWEISSQPLNVPECVAHGRCCGGRPRPGCAEGLDHFAAYPFELVRRIILGWSPSAICLRCGEGRTPVSVAEGVSYYAAAGKTGRDAVPADQKAPGAGGQTRAANGTVPSFPPRLRTITGYRCACTPDGSAPPPSRPSVVLDPFSGTGTTLLTADVLGRHGIGAELSADYCRLQHWRTTDPGERARALGVPKPPPVPDGQLPLDLFGEAS